jgi:UDP:flavonoid glycosyltransferase YjiC (YdhE family)
MNRFVRRSSGGPPSPSTGRPRVLLVSEAVTLAQVVRLVVLGQSLDPERYEVHFASGDFPPQVFGGTRFVQHPLFSLPAARVHAAVAQGRRVYDTRTLERYVAADLEVLDRVRPALVVGDLRWSLTVSAPLAGVPHAALANAYWSPHARIGPMPLPEHPLVRWLGPERAQHGFALAFPHVSRHLARPLDALRRRHGLAPLGTLEQILTHGDHTLFADTPALVPTEGLSPWQRYLGVVAWSPPGALPETWGAANRPAVYVTLGSSGDVRTLPAIVSALVQMGADVLVATAGRVDRGALPPGAHVAPFVPGDLASRRAALVVTNGGSSTGYQALSEGVPVLGIPSNLDQYLATQAITRTGAGLCVRAGRLDAAAVERAARRCLEDARIRRAAERLRDRLRGYDAATEFRAFMREVLSEERPAATTGS